MLNFRILSEILFPLTMSFSILAVLDVDLNDDLVLSERALQPFFNETLDFSFIEENSVRYLDIFFTHVRYWSSWLSLTLGNILDATGVTG